MLRSASRAHPRRLQPRRWLVLSLLWLQTLSLATAADAVERPPAGTAAAVFRPDRLAAWCIVPFDDEPRTPTERMTMLTRLGITRYAYDYRA